MIAYVKVIKIARYISEKKLWADWNNGTRFWEYPWILENGHFEKGLKCLDAGCGQSPFPDNTFDRITCVSVLESVGYILRKI